MVKVLNVIGRRPTGGIGAVVKNYQLHFDEKIKYDYLIFSKEPTSKFDRYVNALGSEVFVLPELCAKNFFKIRHKIKRFFEGVGSNYDIVHIHAVNITFLIAPYAKKVGINKIIAHSHATKFSDKKLNALRNQILCLNLKKQCSNYMACSKEAGAFLFGKRYMKKGKVKILKNAIDIDQYRFSREKREKFREEFFLKNETVFGNIGRLSRQKNQQFLIKIFSKLRKEIPNSKLVLVGEGEQKHQIKKLIKAYKLEDDVILLPSRDDISTILSGIDLLIMPSLYEGLPVIGVEALSSGLKCIFSDTISKEFFCPKSFYLNLEKSSYDWSEKIKKVIKQQNDRNEIYTRSMGYDIKKEAPRLISYYKKILNESKREETEI